MKRRYALLFAVSVFLAFTSSAMALNDTCTISCPSPFTSATMRANAIQIKSTSCGPCADCLNGGWDLVGLGNVVVAEGDCGGWPRPVYVCEMIANDNGIVCSLCHDITVDDGNNLLDPFLCTVDEDGDYRYTIRVNDHTGMSCGACSMNNCNTATCDGPCDQEGADETCEIAITF